MEVKAIARFVRMSPRKIRLVVDAVRGMNVNQAQGQLKFMNKAAATPVLKLLNSAVANAQHNFQLDPGNLTIKEIRADDGPTLKRFKPRAMGRATTIRKRTTHIGIILSEIDEKPKVEEKKKETKKVVKKKTTSAKTEKEKKSAEKKTKPTKEEK